MYLNRYINIFSYTVYVGSIRLASLALKHLLGFLTFHALIWLECKIFMDIYHKITVLDMETSDYEVEINRALKKETKDKTKIEQCGKTTSRSNREDYKRLHMVEKWWWNVSWRNTTVTYKNTRRCRQHSDWKTWEVIDAPFNFYNICVINHLVFSLTFLVFCSFWFYEIPKSWILTNQRLFCI